MQFVWQPTDTLTREEIESLHEFLVRMYPDFAPYYERNRYYSAVKPDRILRVIHDSSIIASAKMLWRPVQLHDGTAMLFACGGILVDTAWQRHGLGKQIGQQLVTLGRSQNAHIIFGSTKHPLLLQLLPRYGCTPLAMTIHYTDTTNGQRSTLEALGLVAMGYELQSGAIARLTQESAIDLGTGPL